jgi:hypothetical protein
VEVSSQRPGGARRVEPLLLVLSLLTLVTGLVDAACYLGLGRMFTANMTGNVVLLGFGDAGAQGLRVLAPIVSLVVFLAGAAAGGWLAASLVGPAGAQVPSPCNDAGSPSRCWRSWGWSCGGGVPVGGGGARRYVVIGLLAAGLGLQNATIRRLAVPDITTTVLTMTLTGWPPTPGSPAATAPPGSATPRPGGGDRGTHLAQPRPG